MELASGFVATPTSPILAVLASAASLKKGTAVVMGFSFPDCAKAVSINNISNKTGEMILVNFEIMVMKFYLLKK